MIPLVHPALLLLILLFPALLGLRWLLAGPRRMTGLVLLLLVATVVGFELDAEHNLDLNPLLSDKQLLGSWSGHDQLELRPGGDSSKGHWSRRGDFELLLGNDDLRLVTYRGRPRLVQKFQDPDSWDGRFLYSKD